MANNQYAAVLVFDLVMESTKDKPALLKNFQMKRPRLSLDVFWDHLVSCLGIDSYTEAQAAKILWKLSNENLKLSTNLLYKVGTVCLILAEKLYDDETNSLESFSIMSGVSMKDLRQLEVEVLTLLNFDLNLNQEELQLLPPCLTKILI